MKTLYVDNYKGFKDTFLPLYDVNFLVGENSTGKTAIVNLLNILSNPAFWLIPDFNNEDVELGYFDEIVNQYSRDKTYFSIGIEFGEAENEKSTNYLLMRFKKEKNIPAIFQYKYLFKDKNVQITIKNKSIHYQFYDYIKSEKFDTWVKEFDLDIPEERVKVPTFFRRTPPFGVISKIVNSKIMGNDKIDFSEGVSVNPFLKNYLGLAPIRAKAKRTYDAFKQSFSPEGDHAPILLRNILSETDKDKSKTIIDSLIKFGKESSLFDGIKIDEYGKHKSGPFAIEILYNSIAANITNVGYGVSQIIPLIVEILTSKNDTLAIQQPEVHLHPKAQAAFGEFIHDSIIKSKNKFIIETHSDYTINRFRYCLFKSENENKINAQVVFFEKSSCGTKLTSLKFNSKGQYPANLPENFSNFFIDEELKMLDF